MTYKLLRVKEGICHFSEVTVQTVISTADEVIEDLKVPPNQELAEVSRTEEPDWVDAGLQGCYDALEFSRSHGRQQKHCVRLRRIVGVPMDTVSEDVRIAAFMAAWASMLPDSGQLELTFENNRWHAQKSNSGSPKPGEKEA